MSVILNYKEFQIGKLDFDNNSYIYSSLPQEADALKKYVGLVDYDLKESKNKKSQVESNKGFSFAGGNCTA